jgi:hypothetical protein
LRGRRSVDPHRRLERDWIVELPFDSPASHPNWLNSLFDCFPRRYHFFTLVAALTLISGHALPKCNSASREGFGPANQP